ncbi:hypothetical protein EG329_004828 [Mollisiaceae sp. DMI_Dod_QoI]|nr:hypothetical protein EG329_004828 [Helotiales sp. DMI_Dod_QoI]
MTEGMFGMRRENEDYQLPVDDEFLNDLTTKQQGNLSRFHPQVPLTEYREAAIFCAAIKKVTLPHPVTRPTPTDDEVRHLMMELVEYLYQEKPTPTPKDAFPGLWGFSIQFIASYLRPLMFMFV